MHAKPLLRPCHLVSCPFYISSMSALLAWVRQMMGLAASMPKWSMRLSMSAFFTLSPLPCMTPKIQSVSILSTCRVHLPGSPSPYFRMQSPQGALASNKKASAPGTHGGRCSTPSRQSGGSSW